MVFTSSQDEFQNLNTACESLPESEIIPSASSSSPSNPWCSKHLSVCQAFAHAVPDVRNIICCRCLLLLLSLFHVTPLQPSWFQCSCPGLFQWSEVAQSCPTLCFPMDCSPPGSPLHGISQARILEWVATSFSRGPSRPRDWNRVSGIVGRHFTVWDTREVGLFHYPFIAPSQTWAAFPSCFSDTGLSEPKELAEPAHRHSLECRGRAVYISGGTSRESVNSGPTSSLEKQF